MAIDAALYESVDFDDDISSESTAQHINLICAYN